MQRPANILFLAILIGALSAAMVYRYLSRQQAELRAALDKAKGVAVDVVVAKEPILIGSRITPEMLKAVRWPADARPDGALADVEDASGRIALTTFQRNQPLSAAHLTTESSGLLPLLIEEGKRAMSVKVDKVTGVSGFITPNSHVDVLVSGTVEGEQKDKQRSKLILQNIKVLATGTSIEQVDDKPVEVPTVTLLVSPEQAEKLTLASRQDPVRLALRNYRDTEDVDTPGATTNQLFGLGRPSNGKQRARRPAAPARPSVEILLGETRTRQTY